MAFIVEDGTGLATANSYVSVAYADDFHSDRGNTSWASATTATQQAALIKATDYVESNYTIITGSVLVSTQALQWPRIMAIDRNGFILDSASVPRVVKDAACILALVVADGTDINAPIERTTKREQAGPVEVEYTDNAAARTIYAEVNGLLRGLVSSSSNGRLLRG